MAMTTDNVGSNLNIKHNVNTYSVLSLGFSVKKDFARELHASISWHFRLIYTIEPKPNLIWHRDKVQIANLGEAHVQQCTFLG